LCLERIQTVKKVGRNQPGETVELKDVADREDHSMR
jgi:hypothetical protein